MESRDPATPNPQPPRRGQAEAADEPLDRVDVRHLLDALHDPRQAVASVALRALSRLPLVADVAAEVDTFVNARLAWIAGDGDWPPGYDPEKWYRPVIEAAVCLSDDPAANQVRRRQLYRILDRGEPELQRLTAHALADAGDTTALSYLIDYLEDGDAELRRRAARSLTWLNISAVRHHLQQLCSNDPDPWVRLWLALALARIGDEAGLQALLDAVGTGTVAALAPEQESAAPNLWLVQEIAARGPFPRPVHDFVRLAASAAGQAPENVAPRVYALVRLLLGAFDLARQRAYGDEGAGIEGGSRAGDAAAPAPPADRASATVERGAHTRVTEVEPRWLQAQVLDEAGQRCQGALRAEARHRLRVCIGQPEEGWITAPVDAPFPASDMPDDQDEYELRVIFWEAKHVPQPLVGSIYLPRFGGTSTTCEFQFRTAPETSEFAGRIVVAYENRILQTMTLEAIVVSGREDAPADQRVSLTLNTFVRANLADLDGRPRIDLSLLVDIPLGVTEVTQITDGHAAFRSLENLDLPLQRLRRRLSRVAAAPDAFPPDLNAQATVELLRFLARQGRLLYNGIVETQIGAQAAAIRQARRIQLVSARESFLPLEFVYDGPSPTPDAALCPNATGALETGECASCDYDATTAPNVICPVRFWCMSRVIERHAVRPLPESGLAGADYAIRADPIGGREVLNAPHGALSAASDHVREDQLEALLRTLGQVTVETVEYVEDWDAWRNVIRRRSPSLLVLLPHTLEDEDYIPTLEIGAAERLPEDQITADCVHGTLYSGVQAPIVLLLGCETAVPDIPFQAFAAQFRLNGAAIVLSTLTPVLGRHAVPVAQLLLEELHHTAQIGGVFGEALLAVRRRALAMGIPMVLSLVAYGDADWRLQPGAFK